MKNSISLDSAIAMLPRYDHNIKKWQPSGRHVMTSARVMPLTVQRLIRKSMNVYLESQLCERVEMVDVSRNNIWVFHASLKCSSIRYLRNRGWSWQRWKKEKLPYYIKYKGKLVIWNGTHRMTLCRLVGRPVRARLIDMDKWLKLRKSGG